MGEDPGTPVPASGGRGGAVAVRVADMADPAEAPALLALRRAAREEQRGAPIDDPDFAPALRAWLIAEASKRTMWVAEVAVGDEVVPIGMLNLLDFRRMPTPGSDAGGWGYVGNVFVHPEHRGAGVGRLLIDVALAAARERGYARVVLSPSARSVPLYRRAGFVDAADGLLVHPLR